MNCPFISDFLNLKQLPEINGWGVFTSQHIKKGTTIEISPVIFYPQKLLNVSIFMSIAEGIKSHEIGIDQYSIAWPDTHDSFQKSAIMLGYLSMYNHSANPNARFYSDFSDRLMGIIADTDIQANSQITVSYGPDWFNLKKNYLSQIDY